MKFFLILSSVFASFLSLLALVPETYLYPGFLSNHTKMPLVAWLLFLWGIIFFSTILSQYRSTLVKFQFVLWSCAILFGYLLFELNRQYVSASGIDQFLYLQLHIDVRAIESVFNLTQKWWGLLLFALILIHAKSFEALIKVFIELGMLLLSLVFQVLSILIPYLTFTKLKAYFFFKQEAVYLLSLLIFLNLENNFTSQIVIPNAIFNLILAYIIISLVLSKQRLSIFMMQSVCFIWSLTLIFFLKTVFVWYHALAIGLVLAVLSIVTMPILIQDESNK